MTKCASMDILGADLSRCPYFLILRDIYDTFHLHFVEEECSTSSSSEPLQQQNNCDQYVNHYTLVVITNMAGLRWIFFANQTLSH